MRRFLLLTLLGLGSLPCYAADDMAHVLLLGESRPVASRLEEARKRISEKKWPEALALLQSVIEASPNDLVPHGKHRALGARRSAQTILAHSGPECLALYRKRVESQAQRLLEAGDSVSYHRLIEESLCSTQAVVALDRLGDQAFLAGRLDEAEAWWAMVSPLEPADLADALVCPDPPAATVARVRAKQLLARLQRGEPRWQARLDTYRRRHPEASGALAGRSGKYADILAECAKGLAARHEGSQEWATFGGKPSRGEVQAGPEDLPGRLGQLCRSGPTWRFDLGKRARTREIFGVVADETVVEAAQRQAFHPVVVGHTALVADARYITAYDLRTGKASEWYDAAAYVGGLNPRLALPAVADLRYTLTVAEDCVFARMGSQTIRDLRPDPKAARPPFGAPAEGGESVLVSLSWKPGADGDRRRWHVRAVDPGRKEYAVFEGAPVVVAGRVYIAATRFVGDKVVTAIHCYPAHPEDTSAPLLWKTDICETRELLPSGGDAAAVKRQRTRHHLLTVTGSTVVYCSHSGAIVALDPRTGRRVWAHRYPKRDDRDPEDEPRLRDLVPPLFADGRLYVAPTDSDRLFCLDPSSGETLWHRDGLDVVHLLGVGSDRLIFTTWRNPQQGKVFAGGLRAVDARDGSDQRGWNLPDDGGGLVPMGRGQLVGDLVLWPTARKPYGVFAIRQEDGRQPDNPALLHRIPSGNLVFANGCLLVADQQVLSVFVPPSILPDEDTDEQVREGTDARDLAQFVRTKQWRRILTRPDLSRMSVLDERGVPRLAGVVSRRELKGSPDEERLLCRFVEALPRRDRDGVLCDLVALYPESREARRLLTLEAIEAEKTQRYDLASRLWLRLVSSNPEAEDARTALARCWVAMGHLGGGQGAPLVSPLEATTEIRLLPGEILLRGLAPTGPCASFFWSVQRGKLRCRSRFDGEIRWARELPLDDPWAALHGPLLLVGDARCAFAVEATTGANVWTHQVAGVGMVPETRRAIRVVETPRPAPLSDPILVGGRLILLRGQRSLLALDALTGDGLWHRIVPGAAFDMPSPRGRIHAITAMGEDRLVTQVSAHRMLLDTVSGEVIAHSPTLIGAWEHPPIDLGAGRVAVLGERNVLDILDLSSGKLLWQRRVGPSSLHSGESPSVVAAGKRLLFLEPLNIGTRLWCLDRETGAAMWARPAFLAGGTSSPRGWVVGEEAFYHPTEGHLESRSLRDGALLWRRSLEDADRMLLVLSGSTLLAYPRSGHGVRFGFRSLLGSLQWRGGVPREAEASVHCFDAASGELVQRINLDVTALVARRSFDRTPNLLPGLWFRRDARAVGPEVRLDGEGLLVGVGNQVKVLHSRAALRK